MSCDDKAPQDLSSLFAKVRSWKQESSRRQGSVDECRRLQSTLARGHRNLHNSQALSQAAVTNPFSHQHGRTNTSSSSSSHSPSNLDSSHLRAMNVLNGRASAPQSYPTHITNCEQTNQQSKMDQIGLCAVNGSGSELLTRYRASTAYKVAYNGKGHILNDLEPEGNTKPYHFDEFLQNYLLIQLVSAID